MCFDAFLDFKSPVLPLIFTLEEEDLSSQYRKVTAFIYFIIFLNQNMIFYRPKLDLHKSLSVEGRQPKH